MSRAHFEGGRCFCREMHMMALAFDQSLFPNGIQETIRCAVEQKLRRLGWSVFKVYFH